MTEPHMTDEDAQKQGVISKLKAHRAANEGDASFTLPETQVEVAFPKFRNHGTWMSCLRMAKNNLSKAQILYLCRVCKFDGEKLTETDFRSYVPMNDANELIAAIFGSYDDGEEDGNGVGKN